MQVGWKALGALAMTAALAACGSIPNEPRYSIYADQPAGAAPRPPAYAPAPTPSGEGVRGATDPATEAPPPMTAPVESIEGGALGAPLAPATPARSTAQPAAGPASEGFRSPPPPARGETASAVGASVGGEVAYVIQPGDTISGVGRRFQTPVQTLIDLNALGPRGAISSGQRIRLPETAVDTGMDPYATGPSPSGVYVPDTGETPPPPPPPPSGNAPMPAAPRQPAPLPAPARQPAASAPPVAAAATPAAGAAGLDWPVRGDIVRRFGPVGMGERNNGINIGASAGAEVKASAAGRVGYVGDDLAGQGLTVLIVHRDGWRTVYGHLGSTTVRDGDDVRAGQTIGTVGTTAGDGRPSIHYEIWRMRGDQPNAVDPLTVLPR